MRFVQYLNEAIKKPAWFAKTYPEAVGFLNAGNSNPDYIINKNLEVVRDRHASITKLLITEKNLKKEGKVYYFPFQIVEAANYLEIRVNGDLGSLQGLPDTFNNTIFLTAKSIVFDKLPTMGKGLALAYDEEVGMKSLTGINKAKTVLDYVTVGDTVTECILGLATFTYKTRTEAVQPSNGKNNLDLREACQIISQHIANNNGVGGDILDCKEELMTNGYKEYAKL